MVAGAAKLFRWLALWIAPLVLAADLQTSDLQAVISALKAQDYQAALTLAKELTAKSAADPRSWTLEGMANEGLKNTAAALHDYSEALHLNPDYLPALKAQAQLEYLNNDERARETLERIVKHDPADQVSHAMLAGLAYKQGNCASAVTQYRQCPRVIATRPDALTQFGECLLAQQDATEAVPILTQVVQLEPGQWWSRYNLAAAEMSRKKPADALKVLQPILHAPPVPPQVLDLAAGAYESLGDTPHAVELLRKAILTKPENETYYLHFADLCFDHTSFQVGIDMINAGLTRLPQSAKLYVARGILWGQLGDFARAGSDFDRADHLDGQGVISAAASSLAELQNSNLDKALQVARTRLKSNPQDPMLHYVKAEALKQMGVSPSSAEFREALESASTAVRLNPEFVAARNLLGNLYMQENKLQLAGEQFDAVLKIDGADQTALYRQMQVLRKIGRSEDIPRLMEQLAQAKITQHQRDQAASRYRLVEAPTPPESH